MKRNQMTLAMLACVLMLVAGRVSSAKAGFFDYAFTVDNSQSYMTLYAKVDPNIAFCGADSDSDTTSLSGTMGVNLTPVEGTYTGIQIHSMDILADESLELSMSWLFGAGTATMTGTDIGLLMDETHGSPGPATSVSADQFVQTGNMISGVGVVTYNAGGLGISESGTKDLGQEDPYESTLSGSIVDLGSVIQLTLNVNITMDLKEIEEMADYLDSGTATITGQIVAYADKPLLGDANGDSDVNSADYTIWADHYGAGISWAEGDFNLDGQIDSADYTIWADHYGQVASGIPSSIPEPATMSLLGVGALALLKRRSR